MTGILLHVQPQQVRNNVLQATSELDHVATTGFQELYSAPLVTTALHHRSATVPFCRASPNYFTTWGNSRKQRGSKLPSLAAQHARINYITGLLNSIKGIKIAEKGKGNVTGDAN